MRVDCSHCANRGVLVLRYKSGEPFDLAVCTCQAGAYWMAQGESWIRQHFNLDATHQVGSLADIEDESPPLSGDFLAAGEIAPRAKL